MKKIFTLLLIIASFGCNNKKTEPYTLSIDTMDRTISFYLEEDVRMMEGKITDVDLSYFNHGDTLVLDVNSPGHWRHKRPNEVIGEYVYLGTVVKVDSCGEKKHIHPTPIEITHDASEASVAHYVMKQSNKLELSIHNIESGMMGTIFFESIGRTHVKIKGYLDEGETIISEFKTVTHSNRTAIIYAYRHDLTPNEYGYSVDGSIQWENGFITTIIELID